MKHKVRRKRKSGGVHAPLFSIPCIISLGSGGGRILSRINPGAYHALKIAVNNSERDIRMLHGVNKRILAGTDTGGSGMDVSKGRLDFLNNAPDLTRAVRKACEDKNIKDPDVIPLIGTLGHGFGSGSLPEALTLLRDEFPNTLLMPFVVTPFHFQGPQVRERAMESIRRCRQNGIPIIPISNHVASQRMGLDPNRLGYNSTYMRINEVLADLLSSLFSALSAEDGVVESIDRNDLKQIWEPESILIGHATYSTHTAVNPSSLKDAEKNIYIDFRPGKVERSYPTSYIIDTGGHVSIGQIESINAELGAKYHIDWSKLKPLIIERDRADTKFILIRGGVDLDV